MDGQEPYYSLKSLQKLKSLCKMLRHNADEILTGKLSVTIASNTLYELNEAIDNLQDGLSPPSLALDVVGSGNGDHRSESRVSDLEDWNFHLQLVLDIVSEAPILVLYKPAECVTPAVEPSSSHSSAPSNSTSSSQPLRLGYFTSLSHLEITSVPVQSIQDLLKMRERLRTLVVFNCASSNFHLQDVLEMCDQEVSVPMQWAVLKHLCVRCNHLEELDGSLRLCPRLELLDLSKNMLTTTDMYLGYLMDLTHLDLSHNHLTMLPSVSATAKKKLRVLKLQANKISSLTGVEEMTSLQELDMTDNMIATHQCLQPVKGLHRLDKLSLKGCPATMRKDHRILALQFISTVSLSRKFHDFEEWRPVFLLDDHHVTHKEIQNSRAIINHSEQYRPRPRIPQMQSSQGRPMDRDDRLSHLLRSEEELTSSAAEDLTVSVTSMRKKKGRKKAKTRTMDIPEMDVSGGDLSSKDVTPSTTPKTPSRMETLAQLRRQEVQETRAEMEHLRRYYGENWLQAVSDQGVLPRAASVVNTNEATSGKFNTLRKSGTDVALVVGPGNQSVTAKVDVHTDESGSKNKKSDFTAGERASSQTKSGENQREEERVFKRDDLFLSSSSGAEDGGAGEAASGVSDRPSAQNDATCTTTTAVTAAAKESDTVKDALRDEDVCGDGKAGAEVCMDGERHGGGVGGARGRVSSPGMYGEHGDGARGRVSSPRMYGEHRGGANSAHDSSMEPEEQSDPFIVSLPDRQDDPFIVTVSPRYLVEKDINGTMKDKLDLQSLEAVRMEREKVKDNDNTAGGDLEEVKVILEFSSIRKDRRSRVYVMEDLITAQHLCELVQPFVDAKVEAARKKLEVMYQCLKCSGQFQKGEATAFVYRESIPRTGSIRDFNSVANIGGKKEVLQCPKCQSDHIIVMETEHPPHPPEGPSSLPPSEGIPQQAPFLLKQSLDQLLKSGSPKAHSTPKKQSGSSSETNGPQPSPDRKGSRPDASRGLFAAGDGEGGGRGEKANPSYPAASLMESAALSKQEEETLQPRRRSNAFYDQLPPAEGRRRRSDAITSPTELLQRRTSSSSATEQTQDGEEAKPRLSGSVTTADSSQLATFGALNNLHLSTSVNSSDGTPARTVSSSADSDIAILNKRDSAASVAMGVGSWQVASDVSQADPRRDETAVADLSPALGANTPPALGSSSSSSSGSSMVLELKENSDLEGGRDGNSEGRMLLLSPVQPQQQEREESVEGTPMGSPLSQSICSSMVSSMYTNSLLLPNASASDLYVSANEYYNSTTAESQLLDSDGEKERSIYDQGGAAPLVVVRRSSHKLSVSSEVEVLSLEESDSCVSLGEDSTTFTSMVSDPGMGEGGEEGKEEGGGGSMVGRGEDGDNDFTRLDHRLALHLMMTVFDNNEEFKFKVKTCVCQYMMQEEYEALVAVTSLKLYILRINTEDENVELGEGLTLMEAQPHAELKRVDAGLGRQTLRLEFVSDCSSYTLVMRDAAKVDAFAELLRDQLQAYSEETGVPPSVVFNEGADQKTLDTLSADVLDKGRETQQTLLLYSLGYIARGHNPQYPIAFVVSTSEVCLVRTNHQWPSPQYQTKVTVDTVGKQFTVLERQRINNIATLEVNESSHLSLRVTFFNESPGDETRWLVSMETSQGVKDFVEAVRGPWELEFDVPMDVGAATFDLNF